MKRLWYVIDTNRNVPLKVPDVKELTYTDIKASVYARDSGVWYTQDKMEAKDVRRHFNNGSESLDAPVFRYQIRRGYDHIHGGS
tara:strand:+ start:1951 stop:2202 length:252 start_codon:yes stop_codon:yes gene_type:complete